jgi:hypothetical protein
MPTIKQPLQGETVDSDDIPVEAVVDTDDAVCCIYVTQSGNPGKVLAGPYPRQATGDSLDTSLDIGTGVSGAADLYVCESPDGDCSDTPNPETCPHVGIVVVPKGPGQTT